MQWVPDMPSVTNVVRDLGGARVLVVDDDPDVLTLIDIFLTNANAKVLTATSADAAIAQLDGFRPDVIVSDIDMPMCDGYQLIKTVRARSRDRGGAVPAIALTAHGRDQDRARAMAAGFDMHVRKPMRAIHLLTAIREVLTHPPGTCGPVAALA